MTLNNNRSSINGIKITTKEDIKFERDVNNGVTTTQPTSESSRFETGNQFATDFLEVVSGAEITVDSAIRYRTALRAYIRHLSKHDVSLETATIKDVRDFYRTTARNGLSKSTLDIRNSAIKKMYIFFKLEQILETEIDVIYFDNINTNDFLTRNWIKKNPLSEDELDRLCHQIDDWRNRFMILLDSEIGARNEALRVIELSHVHLSESGEKDDIIQVPNTKIGGCYPVPISNQMAMSLERWIEIGRESIVSDPGNTYLFPSKRGGKLDSGGSLWEIVHEAAEKAGLQEVVAQRKPTEAEKRNGVKKDMIEYHRVTPHLLRHTFSFLLEQAGLNTEARRDALDHQSVETTRKYYTHTKSDYERLIRELLH